MFLSLWVQKWDSVSDRLSAIPQQPPQLQAGRVKIWLWGRETLMIHQQDPNVDLDKGLRTIYTFCKGMQMKTKIPWTLEGSTKSNKAARKGNRTGRTNKAEIHSYTASSHCNSTEPTWSAGNPCSKQSEQTCIGPVFFYFFVLANYLKVHYCHLLTRRSGVHQQAPPKLVQTYKWEL